jgi:flagellar hook-associated protein 1 FlgK
MSLYSSIRLANNTLRSNQIAMQVVGQNIANANTPGYIREEVVFSPAPTQKVGGLLLGMGVEVRAVIQKIDLFLEERLRWSASERAGAEVSEQTYSQLEGVIGELGDTDLSSSMNEFFSSISEILNQPENVSVRNLAVLKGMTLAQDISRMAQRVTEMRTDLNDRVYDMGDRINKLTEEIQKLNIQIAETEGGDVSASDAVGLRDQRLLALENLAKIVKVRVKEQPSGGVTVYTGGDFLVFDGTRREVEVVETSESGITVAEIRLKETDSPIDAESGELHGLVDSRDNILGGFADRLDDFARTLAFEFNKIFSAGQGLNGYGAVSAEYAVDETDAELDQAGLRFTPVNGSFQVMVHNTRTGLFQTSDILVDLNGIGDDMTMDDLLEKLNAVDGISAEVSTTGVLSISSDSPDQEFSFADDSSGLLAALGINTFFSGYSARGLGVNQAIQGDPAKFAASRGGIGADTDNGVILADFLDRHIETHNGESIGVIYDRMMGETAQGAAIARSVAEGDRVFEDTLQGQKLATSGVTLDEEAVRLISYQHSFQASARYIGVLGELLDILVNL